MRHSFGLFGITFLVCLMPTVSAEVEVMPMTSFDIQLLIPMIIATLGIFVLWRWLLPLSLRDLQVAFEVDDDLYEVHRLSRSREESRRLLDLRGVSMGVIAYLMAMGGVMLIIVELLIEPSIYFEPILIVTALMIIIPIILSPIVTMYAQIRAMNKRYVSQNISIQMVGYFGTTVAMIVIVSSVLFYGYTLANASGDMDSAIMIKWIGYALLIFMSPTILAYGRIMGASWNTLILSKWRTVKGWRTPIDPDKPSFMRRFISLLLVIFLATMPLTAINGIVTLVHVTINQPADSARLLDVGGILGEAIYTMVENQPLLQKIISLKTLEEVLAGYLMLNVAIVGLAFIFELTRNLFLGGQTFGGIGGVILAQPRDIRTERDVQGRILFFGLAGFSGYIILLLVLQTYKEFSGLMPYGSHLDDDGQLLLLQET